MIQEHEQHSIAKRGELDACAIIRAPADGVVERVVPAQLTSACMHELCITSRALQFRGLSRLPKKVAGVRLRLSLWRTVEVKLNVHLPRRSYMYR